MWCYTFNRFLRKTCEEWWRHTKKICVVFYQFQFQDPRCRSSVSFILAARFLVCVSIEICFSPNIVIWDSVVGIVTRLQAGWTGVWILVGREFPPPPQSPASSRLFIGCWGFFPWRKWLGHEADYAHPSGGVGSCTSTLPVCLRGVCTDTFTCTSCHCL